jgi:hypothetical protein
LTKIFGRSGIEPLRPKPFRAAEKKKEKKREKKRMKKKC